MIVCQFLATILSGVLVVPACIESETIASDPNAVNGAASYVYDPVGNRTQKTSTIPGYPGGLTNYNANDQISTDSYDNDGNTTASNGVGYVYDFENRLVQAGGGISIVYDGDGNRVSKTVAGVTTTYLVDDQNPTGYAQVVYEALSGSTTFPRESSHTFTYGLERVLEIRNYQTLQSNLTQTIYFVYDGHGSVRALTDANGAVTDTYDYDAFGNLLHSTGTTLNNYRFAGEQFDSDLNLYYNRARYLNTRTGRFWSMDSEEGDRESPLSLHKYLYAGNDPVINHDPSGHDFGLADALVASTIASTINAAETNVFSAFFTQVQNGGSSGVLQLATEALFTFVVLFVPVLVAVVRGGSQKVPLRFSQDSASRLFSKAPGAKYPGETIDSLARKIRLKQIAPESVEVNYVVRNGNALIENNRSSAALIRAGVPPERWNLINRTGDLEVEQRVTTHLSDAGLSEEGTDFLRIRGTGRGVSIIGGTPVGDFGDFDPLE
jgi:RHS repeat-associated protein